MTVPELSGKLGCVSFVWFVILAVAHTRGPSWLKWVFLGLTVFFVLGRFVPGLLSLPAAASPAPESKDQTGAPQ